MSIVLKYKNSILLWAILSDESLHPCATDVSAVFIKDLTTKKTDCFSFGHPDLTPVTDKVTFAKELSDFPLKKWVFDKKSFMQLLPVEENLHDFNLWTHLQSGKIMENGYYNTFAHKFIYRTKRGCGDLNRAVPLLKHREVFEFMCDEFFKTDTGGGIINEGYDQENEVVIETLSKLESNGIYVDRECFEKHFDAKVQPNGLVYSQYNIYTSTGRPSNHFDGVNYAALNKDDGSRSCFVSRYGNDGTMILIDYSAFHPRIICNLVDFPLAVDVDIYKYLGKMYFKREITEYDMAEIKSITMRQLYGGVEEKYEHIKYFSELKEFMMKNWKEFQETGCVFTPIFKRIITDKHLHDANPAKLFNYILQATETEVALSAVKYVNMYLRNKKTKAVLYTYDSVLFDLHNDEGAEVLKDIMTLMTMDNRFPIKVYKGDSYQSVTQIYP